MLHLATLAATSPVALAANLPRLNSLALNCCKDPAIPNFQLRNLWYRLLTGWIQPRRDALNRLLETSHLFHSKRPPRLLHSLVSSESFLVAGTRTVWRFTLLLAEARLGNVSKRQWIQVGATTTSSDGIRNLGTHHSNGEETLQREAYIYGVVSTSCLYTRHRARGRCYGVYSCRWPFGSAELCVGLRRALWGLWQGPIRHADTDRGDQILMLSNIKYVGGAWICFKYFERQM